MPAAAAESIPAEAAACAAAIVIDAAAQGGTVSAAAAADAAAPAAQMVRARIHALKPGTWPAAPADLVIDAADIARLAAAYDPRRYHAPVVIGHPATDDPAWGWVEAASVDAAGELWLDVALLPEMAELVRQRRYQAVSLSLWPPQAAGNPARGAWSIKHLGFLGAAAPAVKGLSAARLDAADGDAAVTVTLVPRTLSEDPAMSADNSNTPTDLAERQRELDERERRLAEREARLRREGFEREIDAHVAAARVLGADRDGLVALMERLADAQPVTLAEAGERPAVELLRGFLARLPAQVDLAERGAGAQRGAHAAAALPPMPRGYRLSEAGLSLHERALEHMGANPGTEYLAAVRAVDR